MDQKQKEQTKHSTSDYENMVPQKHKVSLQFTLMQRKRLSKFIMLFQIPNAFVENNRNSRIYYQSIQSLLTQYTTT